MRRKSVSWTHFTFARSIQTGLAGFITFSWPAGQTSIAGALHLFSICKTVLALTPLKSKTVLLFANTENV